MKRKHYEDAIAPLSKARELNPDEFAEKTTLRLILCYQNLHKKTEAAKEVDGFIQKDPQRVSMVLDVCRWLGSEFYNENNFEQAAKYFGLMTKNMEPAKVDKGIWLNYAKSLNDLKNYQDADAAPLIITLNWQPIRPDRAQGFLVLGSAQLGAKDLDPATKSAEQALSLQPEGRLNAEAQNVNRRHRVCAGQLRKCGAFLHERRAPVRGSGSHPARFATRLRGISKGRE